MKQQVCSKCKVVKPVSEFHIDRSRVSSIQRYCKACKKAVDVHGKKEFSGYFILYYLPKERYIGMTKNFTKRKARHKKKRKECQVCFCCAKDKENEICTFSRNNSTYDWI